MLVMHQAALDVAIATVTMAARDLRFCMRNQAALAGNRGCIGLVNGAPRILFFVNPEYLPRSQRWRAARQLHVISEIGFVDTEAVHGLDGLRSMLGHDQLRSVITVID